MQLIYNYPFKDVEFSFEVVKLFKQLDDEIASARKVYEKIIYEHAKKDINGEIVKPEKGDFIIPDNDMKNYKEAMEEFNKTSVTVDRKKLPLSKLKGINFSPAHLGILQEIIEVDSYGDIKQDS